MIDAQINEHLDRMEIIADDVKQKIEKVFKQIDIREWIKDPKGTLDKLIKATLLIVAKSKVTKEIINESRLFVKGVIKEDGIQNK